MSARANAGRIGLMAWLAAAPALSPAADPVALPTPGRSQSLDGEAPSATLWGQVLAQHSAYRGLERQADGREFNRDEGVLSGWALQLQGLLGPGLGTGGPGGHGGPGGWAWRAEASQLQGDVAYQGQTQFGLPLASRSALQRTQLQLALGLPMGVVGGGGFVRSPAPDLSLWLGVQQLQQRRAIQPTVFSSALTERLVSWRGLLALQARATLPLPPAAGGRPLQLGMWAQWARPWRQHLDVDAHGAFDPVRVQPEGGWQRTLQLQAGLPLDAGWTLQAGASWLHEQPGASPATTVWRGGMPVGAVRYPGSTQGLRSLQLGLSHRW